MAPKAKFSEDIVKHIYTSISNNHTSNSMDAKAKLTKHDVFARFGVKMETKQVLNQYHYYRRKKETANLLQRSESAIIGGDVKPTPHIVEGDTLVSVKKMPTPEPLPVSLDSDTKEIVKEATKALSEATQTLKEHDKTKTVPVKCAPSHHIPTNRQESASQVRRNNLKHIFRQLEELTVAELSLVIQYGEYIRES